MQFEVPQGIQATLYISTIAYQMSEVNESFYLLFYNENYMLFEFIITVYILTFPKVLYEFEPH